MLLGLINRGCALQAERYYRGEDHHLPYPEDETWQMPAATQVCAQLALSRGVRVCCP